MSEGSLFEELMRIMRKLRAECPWDKAQSFESLREYVLEEAYEVVQAIDDKNWNSLKEELGDLALQIAFQSVIAEEQKLFTVEDVLQGINAKLIERHPHVFGSTQVTSASEVEKNWENIKRKGKADSVLQGIPKHMGALLRAQKVQQKAAKVGFDWDKIEDVVLKLDEEVAELKEAIADRIQEKIEEEMGDILFSIVNIARRSGINAEDALRRTTNKFIARFQYIEEQMRARNLKWEEMDLAGMDQLWEEAKRNLDG